MKAYWIAFLWPKVEEFSFALRPLSLFKPSASKGTTSTIAANKIKAVCHPYDVIKDCPSGAIKNCPKLPAAVITPMATDLFFALASLDTAAMTTLIDAPDNPSPIIKPALIYRAVGVLEIDIKNSPALYNRPPIVRTRKLPNLSASVPKNGCPIPQIRFCIAIEKANISRLHP